jgi:DNA primase
MPLSRHPARASFTFEIKRANPRSAKVLPPSKTSPLVRSSLAEQVFGKVSSPSSDSLVTPYQQLASERLKAPAENTRAEARRAEPATQDSERRILPDLLSITASPVEERLRQEAEERAVRRKAMRARRSESKPTPSEQEASKAGDPCESNGRTDAQSTDTTASNLQVVSAVQVTATEGVSSGRRISIVLSNRIKRAERTGQPLPPLPAGQRWKRRLPKVCW